MTKSVKFTFVDDNVSVIADLHEDDAPKTTKAMWKMLKEPYEAQTVHGIFEGRKITLEPPDANRSFDPSVIPPENTTAYPLPGDILWYYYPPGAVRGMPNGLWDVMLIYGPETILKNPLGIVACNLWASINTELKPFASKCADIRKHGAKTIRVERIGG